ncbi:hypothetical protein HYV85_05315 [Candidatus Woesearchaeota archaeon]|nr:hypothetical protein [Candidatus Woesearchaeota archaeon]
MRKFLIGSLIVISVLLSVGLIATAFLIFSKPEIVITNIEVRVLSGDEVVKYISGNNYVLNDNDIPTITVTLMAKGDNIKNLKTQYDCDFLVESEKYGNQRYSTCSKQNACEDTRFSDYTLDRKTRVVTNKDGIEFLEKGGIVEFWFQIRTYPLVKYFKEESTIDASDSEYFEFEKCTIKFYSIEQDIVEEVVVKDYLVKNNFKNLD